MATVHHEIVINAPLEKVYEALSSPEKIGTWWDKQTAIETDRGMILEHNAGPEHGAVKLRVVEQVPNKSVEWECISVHPESSPASAWTGTIFIFELAADNNGKSTTLEFRQVGYDEHSPHFEFNKNTWGDVLQNLKKVVEA